MGADPGQAGLKPRAPISGRPCCADPSELSQRLFAQDFLVMFMFVQKQTQGESLSQQPEFCVWGQFHPHEFLFPKQTAPSCERATRAP